MSQLTFVSGNQGKITELGMLLGAEFNLTNKDIDLPELQGEPEEISSEKAVLAAQQIGGPVIVEDTSLCFNALGGLPGPYIKWFLQKLGHEGLNKLLAGFEDKSAYALCVFSYCEGPGKQPIVFSGKTPGTVVPARGPNAFGWDPIFQPEGFAETFAEMTKEQKNLISHRKRAVEQLRQYLIANNLFRKK